MTATPAQRSMAGYIAAKTRWSQTPDRTEQAKRLADGFLAKFERQVDPNGVLAPEVRTKLAIDARAAHMRRLALASSKSRSEKTEPKRRKRRPSDIGRDAA